MGSHGFSGDSPKAYGRARWDGMHWLDALDGAEYDSKDSLLRLE